MTRQVYLANLTPGSATVTVTGAEAKHMGVKRTQPGEEVDLVDGHGNRAVVTVRSLGSEVTCDVASWHVDEGPARPITLVQALVKNGRDEAGVEAAIEAGVTGIIPWQSDRAIAKWNGKEKKNKAKWEAIALAAMKQSRSSHLPSVSDVVTTKQLAQLIAGSGATVLICHESATEMLSQIDLGQCGPIWILVGPEGGISEHEIEVLSDAGARPVLIGPSVLRAGTAGVVAASILNVRTGAW